MSAHLLLFASAGAATVTVGPNGQDYTTISEPVRNAEPGDVILVEPGTYTERLLVKVDLTIRATGSPEETIIADGASLSIIKTWADLTLDGFTVTTRDDAARHCIRVASFGSIVLTNSIVTGCTAGDGLGGGLRLDTDSWGIVTDSVFVDNVAIDPRAARAAHLYTRGDSLVVQRTSFINGIADRENDVGGDGGAIYANSGTILIEDSLFVGNFAADDGGVIGLEGLPSPNLDGSFSDGVSELVLRNNVFENNSAGDRGGLVFARDVAEVDISGNTVCMSSAGDDGGALYLTNTGGTISNNVFVDSFAGAQGGALYLKGEAPTVRNNHFVGNEAPAGGGSISAVDVPDFDVQNDLFAWTRVGEAVKASGITVPDNRNNGFFANVDGDLDGLGGGPGDVSADPKLLDWQDNLVCGDDNLRPRKASPLVDAGVATLLDADGTVSDIGAYGGEAADPCLGLPAPLPEHCLD